MKPRTRRIGSAILGLSYASFVTAIMIMIITFPCWFGLVLGSEVTSQLKENKIVSQECHQKCNQECAECPGVVLHDTCFCNVNGELLSPKRINDDQTISR
jgi:hypothetical protein